MRRVLLVVVSGCLAFAQHPGAHAVVLNAEPDDYPAAELESVFSGVRLSVLENPSARVVSATGTSLFLGGANISTTGLYVFARDPSGTCNLGPEVAADATKTWSPGAVCGTLKAEFEGPTDFVAVDVIFDDDDAGRLAAYDSAGAFLEEVIGSGDGRGAAPSRSLAIQRAQRDIGFILASGVAGEGIYLDNLRFALHPVPEPATVGLVALGLATLLFWNRLSRNPRRGAASPLERLPAFRRPAMRCARRASR